MTVSNNPSADEAERERKRRKRQRYRENLKKRKQEESSDDKAKPVEQPILPADDKPIAIIRAVGLEEKPIKPLENLPTDQGKD